MSLSTAELQRIAPCRQRRKLALCRQRRTRVWIMGKGEGQVCGGVRGFRGPFEYLRAGMGTKVREKTQRRSRRQKTKEKAGPSELGMTPTSKENSEANSK